MDIQMTWEGSEVEKRKGTYESAKPEDGKQDGANAKKVEDGKAKQKESKYSRKLLDQDKT